MAQTTRGGPLLAAAGEAADNHEARAALSAQYEAVLREAVPRPLTRVPFLFERSFGAQAIDKVAHAIEINLMMYVLWAIFGIGLGALIRSQNGATVTQALMYTTGYFASYLVFEILYAFVWTNDTMIKFMVLVPGVGAGMPGVGAVP